MIDLPKTFTATVIRDQLRERPGAATFWWNQWWWCDLISTLPALWSYIYIYYTHTHTHYIIYECVYIYNVHLHLFSIYIYVYCTHCMSHCRKYLLFFWVPVSRLVGYKLHQACWSPLDATSRSTPSFSLLKKHFGADSGYIDRRRSLLGSTLKHDPCFFWSTYRALADHYIVILESIEYGQNSKNPHWNGKMIEKKQLKTIFQDSKDIRFTVKILLWITK